MLRFLVHYGIHFIVPVAIAFLFFKERKIAVALLLLSGILIDIDHLWAEPIFDPNRCSIGFHPLHSYWAIIGYSILPFFKKTRLIGLALLLHIIADIMDCLLL
ncbi:DUF6122 family protein [Flagellimonas allohymeniacidonis]|uniref:Metal-dependent hydrolase n=1 Tax=Flagellimonas allohymeniacidonis TaxID=2517819 RepID=A0A4Q8QHP2_9FLAO|nr:DUF6122 family protein [Allomuricauda hymeniacidonis]TAI49307.1 hypothetical protein EW142_05790 [Allomuricauda hymeniacidonis]